MVEAPARGWRAASLVALAGSLGLLGGACSSSPPANAPVPVSAAEGGVVTLGSELTLRIPPGSLSGDVEIKVEKLDKIPDGDKQGFTAFGQGYQLSPHGTEFSLLDPAILKIKYDRPALMAAGLDARTLNVFFLDEDSGNYYAVAGTVDEAEGVVVARIEHFSVYLPMAQALASGSPGPTIALMQPIPSPRRDDAPMMVRATVKDVREGDAIAAVTMKLDQGPGAPTIDGIPLLRDPSGIADVWFAVSEPSPLFFDAFTSVSATNNFGITASVQDPDRHRASSTWPSLAPITLVDVASLAGPTTTLVAGASAFFAVKSVDASSLPFVLVPSSTAVEPPSLGTAMVVPGGVKFTARGAGVGEVKACHHGFCGSHAVKVTNGDIDRLVLLDEYGMPFDGTRTLVEGRRYPFDVRGEDAWGNRVPVAASLVLSPNLGSVDATGLVDTFDGNDYGTLTASLAGHTAVQAFRVLPRQWNLKSADLRTDLNLAVLGQPAIAMSGVAPYIAYAEGLPMQAQHHLYVKHWNGARWVQDGGSVSEDPAREAQSPSIALTAGAPWVAFARSDGAHLRVHVRRWDGAAWMPVGDRVEVDGTVDASAPVLAFAGATPYIAWLEGDAEVHGGTGGLRKRLLVKHWNGSAWVQDGLPLNFDTQKFVAGPPRIAVLGQTPYVAWNEEPVRAAGRFAQRLKHWDGSSWVADPLGPETDQALGGGLAVGRLSGGLADGLFLAETYGPPSTGKGLLFQVPQGRIEATIGAGLLADTPIDLAIDKNQAYALWAPSDRGVFLSYLSRYRSSTDPARWKQNGPDLLSLLPGQPRNPQGAPVLASSPGVQWVVVRGSGSPSVQVLALEAPSLSDPPAGDGGMSMPDLALSMVADMSAGTDMSVPLDLTIAPDFTAPPDLAPPPDLTPGPDLAGALCRDGILNQGEVDVDCGGPCPKCAQGKMCAKNGDCASNVCAQTRCALGLSFSAAKTFAVGPQGVAGLAVADVTGDNILDLLVANRDQLNLGVLAGKGDGTFAKQATYGTGGNPQAVAAGDFDKDGIADLAFAGAGFCGVMLGQKGGGYAPWKNVDLKGDAQPSVMVYDFNGDGDLDVVSGGATGVREYLGMGNAMFGVPFVLAGVVGTALAAADIDGDGALDLVASDNTGLQINRSKQGTLQVAWSLGDAGIQGLATGDVDGDGFADVVAGYGGRKEVGFYKGNKNAQLAPAVLLAAGGTQQARVALADVDLDRRLDLVVTKENDGNVWVLHGHGDGTFDSDQVAPSYPAGLNPRDVVVADVNQDGKPDLVVLDWGLAQVDVLLNNSK